MKLFRIQCLCQPCHSIIFCEVVAIYGVVSIHSVPTFSVFSNHCARLLASYTLPASPLSKTVSCTRARTTSQVCAILTHTTSFRLSLVLVFRIRALLGRSYCGGVQFTLRYLRRHRRFHRSPSRCRGSGPLRQDPHRRGFRKYHGPLRSHRCVVRHV